MTNGEIREALLSLAQTCISYVTRDIGSRMNALKSTMTSRLTDFVRMNPLIFLAIRLDRIPKSFLMVGTKF